MSVDDFLIPCIQNHRALYDCSSPGYADRTCTSNAWEEIQTTLMWKGLGCQSIDTLQKRWKNLRSNYGKNKKRTEKSGHAALEPFLRSFYKSMTWYSDYSETDTYSTPLPSLKRTRSKPKKASFEDRCLDLFEQGVMALQQPCTTYAVSSAASPPIHPFILYLNNIITCLPMDQQVEMQADLLPIVAKYKSLCISTTSLATTDLCTDNTNLETSETARGSTAPSTPVSYGRPAHCYPLHNTHAVPQCTAKKAKLSSTTPRKTISLLSHPHRKQPATCNITNAVAIPVQMVPVTKATTSLVTNSTVATNQASTPGATTTLTSPTTTLKGPPIPLNNHTQRATNSTQVEVRIEQSSEEQSTNFLSYFVELHY